MTAVDVAIVAYATASGAVIAIGAPHIPGWPWLLAARALLIAWIVVLARVRGRPTALHDAYPLVVVPLFFWETPRFAEALGQTPWAFEGRLLAWDMALFGAPSTPAVFGLPNWAREILWLFYFTYYPIVGAGLLVAWLTRAWRPVLTAGVLGFLGAYALFPFFPARAPIHALAGVGPAEGPVFGAVVAWIQAWGGIVGGAFPSAHVAGAWAVSLALAHRHRTAGRVLVALSAGMTIACVWTPYHWFGDALAGLVIGVSAGLLGPRLARMDERRLPALYGSSRQTANRAASTPG